MKANNFVKIVFLIFITILKIQAQLGYVTCNPPSFHSYNFSTNTFTSLANTPVSFGSGGNLVYDGTNVFAMAGAASGIGRTNFYKYTVATNTWTTMSPLPIAANTGASMLFIGDFLYAQVANATNAFYKYDIPNNAWSGLASLPGNIDAGGDLDWDGGDYIYSTQGANGSNGFYRYSINGNSWTTLAPTTFGMRDGGSIKYHSSGYIYALRGGGSRIFARYDIASNTWSDAVVTDTPVDVNDGSALVLYNNKFYTPAGDGTTTFIVYDLSTNTWSTSAAPPPSPFPSAIGNGGHMVSNFEIVTPEICTNGIDDDGDGLVDCADPDCTPCASLRGDCDGNGVVNSADLTAISTEIFDGDGNNVANVAGGTYVGTCGCDANGNGTIDAGDLSCASFLISNPGVYPPCMVDPCYGCLIADAGVTITCTPPNYTIFCNPTGSGLAGKFYNITGDITASNVPFGSPQQVGTVQSINGSSVFFTIESTDGNCSIRVVVGND